MTSVQRVRDGSTLATMTLKVEASLFSISHASPTLRFAFSSTCVGGRAR